MSLPNLPLVRKSRFGEFHHIRIVSTMCLLSLWQLIVPKMSHVLLYALLNQCSSSEMVVHNGGCHCKLVRWEAEAPESVVAWKCDCSDCSMRGNVHFIIPVAKFKLVGDSEQYLTTYVFGTRTAKHTFCRNCGITSFYVPRSNPDGIALTVACLDPGTLRHVEIRQYDGQNWESSHQLTSISSFSKPDGESQ